MLTTSQTPTKWARALHRASAANVLIVQTDAITEGFDERLYFTARSVSRSDSLAHRIRVHATAEGVDVICTCEGGQKRLACQHAAQALRFSGLLPDMELVELPDPMPIAA